MSGNSPALPSMPSGFGTDSAYPPIAGSTRITASQPRPLAQARPPPNLPPLPPGALQAEQERRRHQSASYAYSSSPVPPSHQPSGFAPGQIVYSSAPPPPPSIVRTHSPNPQPPSGPHFVGGFSSPPPPRQATPSSHLHPHQQQHLPSSSTSTTYQQASSLPSRRNYAASADYHAQDLSANMQNLSIQSNLGGAGGGRRASAADAYLSYGQTNQQPPQSQSQLHPHQHASYPQRAPTPTLQQPHSQQQRAPSPSPPPLAMPLPDMQSLEQQRQQATSEKQKVHWAKQVLKYVERNFTDGTKISEPRLVRWTDESISIIIANASSPRPEAEALYLRGDLQASGAFPTYLPKNLKEAFNDFELSARMGFPSSWFRIGRDYEVLNDINRAKDAYERGITAGDVGCVYRLGMANLLGQLNIPTNYEIAIFMLKEAADKADIDTPQPAYIYGMLLAGEFSHVDIPKQLLLQSLPGGPVTIESEARRRIERAAYLNFAPAQHKCGWLYEYAQLECPFDPLLSVQYYSLASQGGEVEADMALSKWFLCGAENFFEKNENLAFTFADKAARKGLASAEFAMGYYYEVGVGVEKNIEVARKWYRKAASKDNTDAKERLNAIQGPQAIPLSRTEHEAITDAKLVRKRTQARLFSEKEGRSPVSPLPSSSAAIAAEAMFGNGGDDARGRRPSGTTGAGAGTAMEISRRKTMKMVEETAAGRRRANYGFNAGNAQESTAAATSQPPVPPPMTMPKPLPAPTGYSSSSSNGHGSRPLEPPSTGAGQRITSGTHPSNTPGRHGTGYTLSDAPLPAAPSAPSQPAGTWSGRPQLPQPQSQPPPQAQPVGFAPQPQPQPQPSSTSTSYYTPPPSNAANNSSNNSSSTHTHLSTNPTSSASSYSTLLTGTGASNASGSVGGSGSDDKKTYATFAEMGFAPQKPKKEDCVIC